MRHGRVGGGERAAALSQPRQRYPQKRLENLHPLFASPDRVAHTTPDRHTDRTRATRHQSRRQFAYAKSPARSGTSMAWRRRCWAGQKPSASASPFSRRPNCAMDKLARAPVSLSSSRPVGHRHRTSLIGHDMSFEDPICLIYIFHAVLFHDSCHAMHVCTDKFK